MEVCSRLDDISTLERAYMACQLALRYVHVVDGIGIHLERNIEFEIKNIADEP